MLLLRTDALPADRTRWQYELKWDGYRAVAFKIRSSQWDAFHALKRVPRHTQRSSKRSRVITLAHALTKSRTNFSFPSAAA